MTMDACSGAGECLDMVLSGQREGSDGLEQRKREAPEHPPQYSAGVREQLHAQLNEQTRQPRMHEEVNRVPAQFNEETDVCERSMIMGSSTGNCQQQPHEQQLQQLSEKLVEQLHVDAKRSRMSPSYCSLCAAAPFAVSTGNTGVNASYPHERTLQQVTANNFGDKQSSDHPCRGCNCPCHGSQGASSIVSIEGPRRPETFAANLAELSRMFPAIHQGVSQAWANVLLVRVLLHYVLQEVSERGSARIHGSW